MQTTAAFLIAEHIKELLREADAARLSKAMASTRRTRSRWRRQVGGVMRRLSGALADLARRLDPAIPQASYSRE
jgi:hypothetical protein